MWCLFFPCQYHSQVSFLDIFIFFLHYIWKRYTLFCLPKVSKVSVLSFTALLRALFSVGCNQGTPIPLILISQATSVLKVNASICSRARFPLTKRFAYMTKFPEHILVHIQKRASPSTERLLRSNKKNNITEIQHSASAYNLSVLCHFLKTNKTNDKANFPDPFRGFNIVLVVKCGKTSVIFISCL